jgi:hypothetical protein
MDQKDVAKVVSVLKCLLLGGEVNFPVVGNARLADNYDLCIHRLKYKVGEENVAPGEVWLGLEVSLSEFINSALQLDDEAQAAVTAFNVLNTKRRKP